MGKENKKQKCPYCKSNDYENGIESHRKIRHEDLWAIKGQIRGLVSKMDENDLKLVRDYVVNLHLTKKEIKDNENNKE